ncbi:hypothetical protein GBA52_008019 [Prunus armeniaca]|nr:hypothetical protein GBA52_008019 [Prunus armeniaca]
MAEVKLFRTWSSPFALRIVWTLKLKGVPYETIYEDLSNKSPLLLQYNPIHKKVPVLVHNGKPIAESLVIVEYIDETWKENPLLPEDPLERAAARFWAKFGDDKVLPSIWESFTNEGKEQEEAIVKAKENLKYLEEELKGKKFFGGEKLGLADIALGWLAHYVSVFEDVAGMKLLTEEEFPLLSAWKLTFADAPIIKDNLPSRDKLLKLTAKMAEVKLFRSWSSPVALRIVWALKLKGVPYETIYEDLSNKSPLLLQYNPIHKKVPVLVHKGKPIAESLVILEYIDETWKENPLLPEDPLERAAARFWAKFSDEKVLPSIWESFTNEGKEQEEAIVKAKENFKYLEEELKGKKFFGGEKLGLADIALGMLAHYGSVFEDLAGMKLLTEEEFPLLSAWKLTFADAPIIKDNWPSRDKLVAKFQATREDQLLKKAPK